MTDVGSPLPAPMTGFVQVCMTGDLDAEAAPAFRRRLEAAVGAGAALILIDMRDVVFLDSAALAVIVGVNRQLPVGQRLALTQVPLRMQRVLRVAAIASLLPVHEQGQPWPWGDVVAEPGPLD